MGAYTAFGIISRISFDKEDIISSVNANEIGFKCSDDTFERIKDDLISQIPSSLYAFMELEDSYSFTLREDIPVSELTDIIQAFYSLNPPSYRLRQNEMDRLNEMNFSEAVGLGEAMNYDNVLQEFKPGRFYYFYPYNILGRRMFLSTGIGGVLIGADHSKISMEFTHGLCALITDLLRYRLKDYALADALGVFVW